MYPRNRRKKRTESMEAAAGERETEEDEEKHSQILTERTAHHRRDLPTNPGASSSLSSLVGNIRN